jgi:chromosome segregation ATPase
VHEKRVTAVVEGDEKGENHYNIKNSHTTVTVDREKCTTVTELEQKKAETALIRERTTQINEHADGLRQQIEQAHREIAARKAALAQRRSDLQSVGHNIDTRRANELEKVQQSIKKADHRWQKRHHETVEARRYLCKEAAKLSGLKQRRKKTKDGRIHEVYYIGPGETLRIINLRDLNSK